MTNFLTAPPLAVPGVLSASRRAKNLRQPLAAALLAALPCLLPASLGLPGVQAQVLKPSSQLRLSVPSTRPAGNANGQRQADFIVAVVNSEPVTNNEVRAKLVRAEQQLTQQGTAMPPRPELVKLVLERLINDKAQLQSARESGVKIEANAIDGAELTVAQQNQVTVEELRRRLVADGISYSQFRADLRDELLVTRVRQREVDARVSVTDSDIDLFLREQGGTDSQGTQDINLGQILIAVPENATPEVIATRLAKAQQAADRAKSGTDFDVLAKELSDTPASATGSQMGLRNADRYPPLFVEATQGLRVGGVAGPVRSGAGFHVLKVLEKKQAGTSGVSITQTRARHILLRVTPQLTQAAAIEKLASFKKRIASRQADFATLAKDNSEDGSAKDGGDLGWSNPGQYVPEFEQVMNNLAPGQISDPLVSRFGVHLIQPLERRESQLSTREQRELARSLLREKKQEDAYAVWAQEIRGRAYIEYREPPQ